VVPVGVAFLSEGGKFWVKKTHPPPLFKLPRAGGARPSELTLCIFLFFYFFARIICKILTFGLALVYFNS